MNSHSDHEKYNVLFSFEPRKKPVVSDSKEVETTNPLSIGQQRIAQVEREITTIDNAKGQILSEMEASLTVMDSELVAIRALLAADTTGEEKSTIPQTVDSLAAQVGQLRGRYLAEKTALGDAAQTGQQLFWAEIERIYQVREQKLTKLNSLKQDLAKALKAKIKEILKAAIAKQKAGGLWASSELTRFDTKFNGFATRNALNEEPSSYASALNTEFSECTLEAAAECVSALLAQSNADTANFHKEKGCETLNNLHACLEALRTMPAYLEFTSGRQAFTYRHQTFQWTEAALQLEASISAEIEVAEQKLKAYCDTSNLNKLRREFGNTKGAITDLKGTITHRYTDLAFQALKTEYLAKINSIITRCDQLQITFASASGAFQRIKTLKTDLEKMEKAEFAEGAGQQQVEKMRQKMQLLVGLAENDFTLLSTNSRAAVAAVPDSRIASAASLQASLYNEIHPTPIAESKSTESALSATPAVPQRTLSNLTEDLTKLTADAKKIQLTQLCVSLIAILQNEQAWRKQLRLSWLWTLLGLKKAPTGVQSMQKYVKDQGEAAWAEDAEKATAFIKEARNFAIARKALTQGCCFFKPRKGLTHELYTALEGVDENVGITDENSRAIEAVRARTVSTLKAS